MADLEVTVSTVLEADVAASTANIRNSIKQISDSVGPVQVEAEIDRSSVQTQASNIAKTIRQTVEGQNVEVGFSVKRAAWRDARRQLKDLGLDNAATNAMTQGLRDGSMQVEKVNIGFEKVGRSAERFVRMVVQGRDEMGRLVTLSRTLDKETGKITSKTDVSKNFKAQTQELEANLSYLTKQQIKLDKLRDSFSGATSTKGLKDESNIARLAAEEREIIALMERMGSASSKLSAEEKANLDRRIAGYERLGKSMQNAEYVANELRAKSVETVAQKELGKLTEYETRLRNAGLMTQEFSDRIKQLKSEISSAKSGSEITDSLNKFTGLKADVSAFKSLINDCDRLYSSLQKVDRELAEVELALQKTDPALNPNQHTQLESRRAALEAEKAALLDQARAHQEIAQYSRQAQMYEQQQVANAEKVAMGYSQIADRAAEVNAEMKSMGTSISATEAKFRELSNPTDELKSKVAYLRELFKEVENASGDQQKVQAYERLEKVLAECNAEIAQMSTMERSAMNGEKFQANIAKAKADLVAMRHQWSAFTKSPEMMGQYRQLESSLGRIASSGNMKQLSAWKTQLSAFRSQIKAAGLDTKTFGDRFKAAFQKVTQYASAVTVLYKAFEIARRGFESVVALDTAMTDLRKTTDATETTYKQFYKDANKQAKELGSTTEEVIQQTANWSRLGYTLKQSEILARNSSILHSISEDLDMQDATDGLVSVLKAFSKDKTVEDSMDGIISKINAVGNAYAVTNSNIIESLKRSSAPMAVANNSMEQTIALATAGTEITRNAEKTGTALKTISMRIRGYDEETEEVSEDVTVLTGKIADLTKVAKNGFKGISIFEANDPNTFRSTYDILDDISAIWDDLNDKQQAGLLEALGGKTRADVVASMISNFQTARNAMETMRNSAGSAEKEMANIQDSIAFKLNALGQTWVGVAQNLYNTDGIKHAVDALTALSSILEKITGFAGTFGTLGIAGIFGAYARTKRFMNPVNEVAQSLDGFKLNFNNFDTDNGASLAQYSSSLATLNSRQADVVMSMNGLNKAQKATMTRFGMLNNAVKEMTVQEFQSVTGLKVHADALNGLDAKTTKMTSNMLASALATNKTSKGFESLDKSITTAGKKVEEHFGVAPGTMMGGLQKAEKGIKGFAKNTAAEFKAMFSSGLGLMNAAMIFGPMLIEIGTKVYDYFAHAAEHALEKAQDELETYKTMKQELSSLNDEYSTNADRIRELESLRQSGQSLTLSEQGELSNLKAINAELQIRIQQQKQLAQLQGETAATAFEDAWDKQRFTSLNKKNKQGYSNRRLEMEAGGYDFQTVGYAEHVDELVKRYKELNETREKGIPLSEKEQESFTATQKAMLDAAEDIRTNYLDPMEEIGAGSSAAAKAYKAVYDSINSTLNPEEWIGSKLATLPNSAISKLEELGAESGVTAQDISNLAKRFPELKQWMDQAGISTDQLVEHFNSLGNISAITGEQITSIEKALTGVESKFSLVKTALANYSAVIEAGDQDANYQSYAGAYQKAIDEYDSGRKHSDSFWSSAELILGAKQLEELGYNADAVKKKLDEVGFAYHKITDDDGNGSYDDMGKAMYDHVKKLSESGELLDDLGEQLISIQQDGEDLRIEVDPSNLDLLADKLGISKTALLAFMQAWGTWAYVDYTNIEDLAKAVDEVSYSLNGLNAEGDKTKTINLQAFTSELENLGQTPEQIYHAKQSLQELGYTFFDITADADDLVTTLSGMGLAVEDGSGKAKVGFDQLSRALHLLGYDSEDIATVLSTLGDNVDFTDAEGKVISLETLLDKLADSHVEPTITIEAEESRNKIQQLVDAYTELEYEKTIGVDDSQIAEAQAKYDELVQDVLGDEELRQTIEVTDKSDIDPFVKQLLEGGISIDGVEVPITMNFDGGGSSSTDSIAATIKNAAGEIAAEIQITAVAAQVTESINQAIDDADDTVELKAHLSFEGPEKVDIQDSPLEITANYHPDTSEVDAENNKIESTPLTKTVEYTETKPEIYKSGNTVEKIEVSAEVKVENPNVSSQVDKTPVEVKVHADPSSMPGEVQSAEASLPSPTVNVTANTEKAESQIQGLGTKVKPISVPVTVAEKTKIPQVGKDIKPINTSVNVNTNAANSSLNSLSGVVNKVIGRVQALAGKRVGNLGLGTALSAASSLLSRLNALNSKKISNKTFTVTQRNVILGPKLQEHAKGTKSAPGGPSLTGEEGPELVRSGRQAYIVGQNGPEIVNLKRGDQVFTAAETKKILKGWGKTLFPAFAEGTGGRIVIGKDGLLGKTYTVEIVARADDAALEEKLKDKIEEAKKAADSIIANFEHDIFLMEHNDSRPEELIAAYRKMQEAIHAQADKYRAMGLRDDSDTIQELQKKWYDAAEKIKDVIKDSYDKAIKNFEHDIFMLERYDAEATEIIAIYKQMQETIHREAEDYRALGLSETSEEIQELQEQWFKYADEIVDVIKNSYDKAIKETEHAISLSEHHIENLKDLARRNLWGKSEDISQGASLRGQDIYEDMIWVYDKIIEKQRSIQKDAHAAANDLRDLGFDEASDEIAEYVETWWNAEEAVRDATQEIIDYVNELVSDSSEAISNLTKALSNYQSAAEEYAKSGYLTVDTFQEIMEYGPQYLSLLEDEEGNLKINKDLIVSLTKARVNDLAVQTAMSYVERLRMAAQEGSIESLNQLIYATEATTSATWDLVYANLAAIDLNGEQYNAALTNINRIRSLADNTASGIEQTLFDETEKYADGVSDLIKYVMDMLEDRLNDQIDKIKEQQDEYSKLIAKKKESLKATKEENEYQRKMSKNLKDAAKIQEKLDLLSLDDSRKSQAEQAKLREQLEKLQEDIADQQSDKMYNSQVDALDKMEDAYKQEKDDEIKILQESVSSYQKKWDQAIAYIQDNYSTLHDELIQWNYDIGSSLTVDIENAWKNAEAAVLHYGSVVEAVTATQIDPKKSDINDGTIGQTKTYENSGYQGAGIIGQMVQNANRWHEPGANKERLSDKNIELGKKLIEYGIDAWRDESSGVWYLGSTGQRLFDLYEYYKKDGDIGWVTVGYPIGMINKDIRLHSGGIVGGGSIKANEQLAILKDDEWVLSEQMVKNLSAQMDRLAKMKSQSGNGYSYLNSVRLDNQIGNTPSVAGSVTNNSPVSITFGDTIIHGEKGNALSQHIKVNEQMVNEIVRLIGVRR